MAGILYLVATPIGNLEDMTFRAIRVLKEADLIAAEDTRNSIKLLNHFEIKKPMTSYHEFNRFDKAEVLIDKLEQGTNIALITDAGTPGISDPGEVLVQMCVDRGIEVIPVPGAVAGINALIASGQSTARFVFEGFIPKDKKEKQEALKRIETEVRTMIIYEAPHRLIKTLSELSLILGGERSLTICKELTKKHEFFKKTTFKEALEMYSDADNAPRGEYVLIVAGRSRQEIEEEKQAVWEDISIEEHLRKYIDEGMSKKEAVKKVSEERNIPKREVYAVSVTLG
ncbi:MAG TPA: 16S rRNA (cytidine(1402)-2'-O)-methyltransferase [Lachnospiraceae bacterium]|nr:16S rRNA (cytidine(1402)-2'-O)-methyltransferase [Eubacterium sp.]HBZ02271.1 16S rRNA (cytidine(1402)-2'-O)-methyltransferase [Lachnospiraceae bacterium]